MPTAEIAEADVNSLRATLRKEADANGYRITPDEDFVKKLVAGLITNERRYGYRACPCRLATGRREDDLDIICPCDYRDPDLDEHGACYCALYVSDEIAAGIKAVAPVPERRPPRALRAGKEKAVPSVRAAAGAGSFPYPVWRCKVCGYLCARDHPPGICPVCKATKDRFERFA